MIPLALFTGAMLWSQLAPEPKPIIYWVSSTGKVHNETCRFAHKFMEKNETEDCDYCGGKSHNPLLPEKIGELIESDIFFERKLARVNPSNQDAKRLL